MKEFIVCLWLLILFCCGCTSPTAYQKETALLITELVKATNSPNGVSTVRIKGDGKIVELTPGLNGDNKNLFDKLFEFWIDVDGVKEWWKIANFNCPNIKYNIIIVNGSNKADYDGGEAMHTETNPQK